MYISASIQSRLSQIQFLPLNNQKLRKVYISRISNQCFVFNFRLFRTFRGQKTTIRTVSFDELRMTVG